MNSRNQRIKTTEDIRTGLKTCGTWIPDDQNGGVMKDCPSCPFRNPADPAGLNCGEFLMMQADMLIGELLEAKRLLEGGSRV